MGEILLQYLKSSKFGYLHVLSQSTREMSFDHKRIKLEQYFVAYLSWTLFRQPIIESTSQYSLAILFTIFETFLKCEYVTKLSPNHIINTSIFFLLTIY